MFNLLTTRWLIVSTAAALAYGVGMLSASAGLAGGELKDPTRPPNLSELEKVGARILVSSPYTLTAILVAEGRRIAVINGQPVQAGDRVSKAEVVSILRDRVVLRAGGEDLTLRLVPRSIVINEAASQ